MLDLPTFLVFLAAALGVSAILATSAAAFLVVKWLGAGYLVYLGVETLLSRHAFEPAELQGEPSGTAMRQGVIAEVLNPKTALFFLAFIAQFVDPVGSVFWQFVMLGSVTTLLTSGVDAIVAVGAGPLSRLLAGNVAASRAQRYGTGSALVGLGVYVAVDR